MGLTGATLLCMGLGFRTQAYFEVLYFQLATWRRVRFDRTMYTMEEMRVLDEPALML